MNQSRNNEINLAKKDHTNNAFSNTNFAMDVLCTTKNTIESILFHYITRT